MIRDDLRTPAGTIIGMARIAQEIFDGRDLTPLWSHLAERVALNGDDAEALYDLSLILQLRGETERGKEILALALALKAGFTCVHGAGEGLEVLAFVTGQDMTGNTPVDFLLADSDCTIHYLHVDALKGEPAPTHDVALLAVGESVENRPFLAALGPVMEGWSQPVMNGRPDRILAMTRDEVSRNLQGAPSILAPLNVLLPREAVEAIVEGATAAPGGPNFGGLDDGASLLIRPIDTDCGRGLERIATRLELADYLSRHPELHFHLAPFVDYSGEDGQFRKQRVTFIDGVAYPAHMAISSHWMVHYLNAGMTESADKRLEEERWMDGFDADFAVCHADAFAALCARIGTDYFSIDCAETRDGRLLFFEADIAAIVHNLDSAALFPYKRRHMARLFAAFEAALKTRAGKPARALAA